LITVDKLSCSIANSLRRIMISEIPTLSIDLVSIEINTSLMNDEFLSHRLGLIPLNSNCIKKLKYTRECECDNYCHKCSSIFKINLKSFSLETILYSTHLEYFNQKEDYLGYSVAPIHDSGSPDEFSSQPILLAKLKLGQHVKLKCVAKKGIGLEHSKWSPISIINIKAEPVFNLNIDYLNTVLNCNQKKELCESGKEFFEFDKKKIWINFKENKIKISNSFSKKEIKFLLDYLSEQKLSSENSIELELNVSRITFLIETTGVLSVENIFKESILVLKRKLNILGVHLEKIH